MDDSGSGGDKKPKPKIAAKADAQVGTWVVPMSAPVAAGRTCERRCPINPAPKAKPKRQRLPPLSLRVTWQQRAAIKAKAKAAGLSVNRYLLLQACGKALAPIRLNVEDRVQRASALRSFRGTGTLLNQIARHLNSGRIIGAFNVAELLKRHQQNAEKVLTAFLRDMPDE